MERRIAYIPKYRGSDENLADILDGIRKAIEGIIDVDFVTEKDIYCRDLITSEASIYIGEKSPRNKLEVIDGQLIFAKKKMDYEKLIKNQDDKIEQMEKKMDDLDKKIKEVNKDAV